MALAVPRQRLLVRGDRQDEDHAVVPPQPVETLGEDGRECGNMPLRDPEAVRESLCRLQVQLESLKSCMGDNGARREGSKRGGTQPASSLSGALNTSAVQAALQAVEAEVERVRMQLLAVDQ